MSLVRSSGNYVRPSHCGIGACPEVRVNDDGGVSVRSSHDAKTVIRFSVEEWASLKQAIKEGEF